MRLDGNHLDTWKSTTVKQLCAVLRDGLGILAHDVRPIYTAVGVLATHLFPRHITRLNLSLGSLTKLSHAVSTAHSPFTESSYLTYYTPFIIQNGGFN